MATEYTVQQGDTLFRIAKAHGFSRSSCVYDHASNAEFRKLRPNPNIIYPGDVINVLVERVLNGYFSEIIEVVVIKTGKLTGLWYLNMQ